MNNLLQLSFLLFAEAGDAGQAQPAQNGLEGLLASPLLLLVMLVFLFYFVVMRPQRKEQARRQDMLANVKKNDRVVTIGGIYGLVMNVHREADEVTIKVDETSNTKLRITLSSISRVVSEEAANES